MFWSLTINPLDLIKARPWQKAFFTTYSLSLSFFEVMILDSLVRGGAHEATILADSDGIIAALSELGATRVGQEYRVEPIDVATGVFHPKISVLLYNDEIHCLVGSGNLTFGGWGANLEVVEHLHPSFAPNAIKQLATFFRDLTTDSRLRFGARQDCVEIAEQLSDFPSSSSASGNLAFIHNLHKPISDQIVAATEELGGAERLVVASPFWDKGHAISQLAEKLRIEKVHIHVHRPGTVKGRLGASWPSEASAFAEPVELEHLQDNRLLHGKAYEVVCKSGRLIVSGSPNATSAALNGRANVEAAVVRTLHSTSSLWHFTTAQSPSTINLDQSDVDEEEGPRIGVLRAELSGSQIVGEVISDVLPGSAELSIVTALKSEHIGYCDISADRTFEIKSEDLETRLLGRSRIVLEVCTQDNRIYRGFVTLTSYKSIARTAGAYTSRLISLLNGTETPDDVVAIFEWFHKSPELLSPDNAISGQTSSSDTVSVDPLVSVKDISPTKIQLANALNDSPSSKGWRRALEALHQALRQPRGAFRQTHTESSEAEEADTDRPAQSDGVADSHLNKEVDKAFARFEALLESLLVEGAPSDYILSALSLANYVCNRLEPYRGDVVRWLAKITSHPSMTKFAPTNNKVAVAALALRALAGIDQEPARSARSRLIRLNARLDGDPPDTSDLPALSDAILGDAPKEALASIWREILRATTWGEYAQQYHVALTSGSAFPEGSKLAEDDTEDRTRLKMAFVDEQVRERLLVSTATEAPTACPKCYIALPSFELSRLRTKRVANCKNRCGRTILWVPEEDA